MCKEQTKTCLHDPALRTSQTPDQHSRAQCSGPPQPVDQHQRANLPQSHRGPWFAHSSVMECDFISQLGRIEGVTSKASKHAPLVQKDYRVTISCFGETPRNSDMHLVSSHKHLWKQLDINDYLLGPARSQKRSAACHPQTRLPNTCCCYFDSVS